MSGDSIPISNSFKDLMSILSRYSVLGILRDFLGMTTPLSFFDVSSLLDQK